ncbi:hypothetical protein LEP1GSC127_3530 [Leptospira kirschneri str. 200801925]|nr:hypothetical protein LEP1GSC127_3530 [Leptospira kirschneri str. 200801925]
MNITKKNISPNSSSTSKSVVPSSDVLKTESSKIQDRPKKENTVSEHEDVSKTESKIKNESSQENLVSNNDFSKSNKNPKIKSSKGSKKTRVKENNPVLLKKNQFLQLTTPRKKK